MFGKKSQASPWTCERKRRARISEICMRDAKCSYHEEIVVRKTWLLRHKLLKSKAILGMCRQRLLEFLRQLGPVLFIFCLAGTSELRGKWNIMADCRICESCGKCDLCSIRCRYLEEYEAVVSCQNHLCMRVCPSRACSHGMWETAKICTQFAPPIAHARCMVAWVFLMFDFWNFHFILPWVWITLPYLPPSTQPHNTYQNA
jgi:hypothetical protein